MLGGFSAAMVAANRKVGPELCVNGTMDSVTTPWSNGAVSPSGSLVRSIDSGRLKCVTTAALSYGYASQIVTAKLGRYYLVSADVNAVSIPLTFMLYNNNNFSNPKLIQLVTVGQTITITKLVHLNVTQYLFVAFEFDDSYGSNVEGGIAYIDNVSVKEVYPA